VTGTAGELRFDRPTGRLKDWRVGAQVFPVTNGPRLAAYRRQGKAHVEIPDAGGLTAFSLRRDGSEVVVDASYGGSLRRVIWRVALAGDAARIDYEYAVEGEVDLLGVMFDVPPGSLTEKRWLGRGPYRVYRNRLDGGVLDLHQVAFNDPVPGQSFAYPEFKGYFSDWRWMELGTVGATLTIENGTGVPFVGLFGPRDGEPPMLSFPDTGLAFLNVIPAIGTKFDTPEFLGPQSRTPRVVGVQQGSVDIRVRPR
jgi:hypothetical protein